MRAKPVENYVVEKEETPVAVKEERLQYLNSLAERTRKQAIKYVRKWLEENGVIENEQEMQYILKRVFRA